MWFLHCHVSEVSLFVKNKGKYSMISALTFNTVLVLVEFQHISYGPMEFCCHFELLDNINVFVGPQIFTKTYI